MQFTSVINNLYSEFLCVNILTNIVSILFLIFIQGRNGKGCIYVFASGNGGQRFDSCATDGYVNSIYTIAVGSADQNGYQADYDENCASKMAVTYSYNSYQSNNQIVSQLFKNNFHSFLKFVLIL